MSRKATYFLNPQVIKAYESYAESSKKSPEYYAAVFEDSEKKAKDRAAAAFRQMNHKVYGFIDTCSNSQREFAAKCENCNKFLYLIGKGGYWNGIVDEYIQFQFRIDPFLGVDYRVYWEPGVSGNPILEKAEARTLYICEKFRCML